LVTEVKKQRLDTAGMQAVGLKSHASRPALAPTLSKMAIDSSSAIYVTAERPECGSYIWCRDKECVELYSHVVFRLHGVVLKHGQSYACTVYVFITCTLQHLE
jgi:hypothetical protein